MVPDSEPFTADETSSYEEPLVIAVMGPTGAGKSDFMNLLIDSPTFAVGHGVVSCTQDIQIGYATIGRRRIALVNTPGFDDTHKSDTETLQVIADWLQATYNEGVKLTGIIYFHRISDNRVGGIAYQNIKLFKMLCGDRAMSDVTICSTMWDKVSPEEGERREQDLCDRFWGPMLRSGATLARHNHTKASAIRVIQRFFDLQRVDLLLQEELAAGKTLLDTSTGREINKELLAWQEKAKKELDQAKADMKEAIRNKDVVMQRMVADEQAKLEEQMQQSTLDAQNLARERQLDGQRWMDTFMQEQGRWRDLMAMQGAQQMASVREVASQTRSGPTFNFNIRLL